MGLLLAPAAKAQTEAEAAEAQDPPLPAVVASPYTCRMRVYKVGDRRRAMLPAFDPSEFHEVT